MDPMQRFWQKVDRRGADECWIWRGRVRKNYGEFVVQFNNQQRYIRAHRVALGGLDLPSSDVYACHHCDNPLCCNPKHLYWGSVETNNADRVLRGRSGNSAQKGVSQIARDMHASGCAIGYIAKTLKVTRRAVQCAIRKPPLKPPLAGA